MPLQNKQAFFRGVVYACLLLLKMSGNGHAQVLFYDDFQQFANGTIISDGYGYTPASGPAAASAEITKIATTTVTMSNLAGSIRAVFNCPASSDSTDYNDYHAIFSVPQTNPVLLLTWQLRINALNPGTLGLAVVQLPIIGNDESTVVAFNDGGQIYGVTNVLSSASDLLTIGSWSNLVGTVMTNQLILNYPAKTITLAINGGLIATLPMRPDLTNYVDHITFEYAENVSYGSLGNSFAIDAVKVETLAPPVIQTTGPGFGVRTNLFGFNITGNSNLVVVVEASTNLASPVWTPLTTNTLGGGTSYFSDSQWTNYHRRFYRVRAL